MQDPVQFLNSPDFARLGLPFSEIVRAGNTLYLSGQIGNEPGTLRLVQGGIRGQARQTLENVRSSLQAHGYDLSNVVKCTVMLADMADWPAFNEIYTEFFQPPYPARSAFAAAGLAMGGRIELDVIAQL
jgi:reactive intermediate/imine deaminase